MRMGAGRVCKPSIRGVRGCTAAVFQSLALNTNVHRVDIGVGVGVDVNN
jgi:hypothetical protein